jgi:hypothetical protein
VNAKVITDMLGVPLLDERMIETVNVDGREPAGRMAGEDTLNVTAGFLGVLPVPSIDLPSSGAMAVPRGYNAGLVEALKLFKSPSLPQIASQVVSMRVCLCTAVLSSGINDSHLHAGGQVLELVNTRLNLIGRSNDVDGLTVVVARGKNEGTSSLLQEVVQRITTVTNNELMAPTLDRSLFDCQLASQLVNLALEVSLNLLGMFSVSVNLDVMLGLWHERHRLVPRDLWRRLGPPISVVRDLNTNVTPVLVVADQRVVGTGKERIILCRDLLQLQVDG